jgi:putative effector of murein hydrolase LrgA (UPF0299 family)
MPGADVTDHTAAGGVRAAGRRVLDLVVGAVPIGAAVGVGTVVEDVTGVPAVVAGLVALTVALVASPPLAAAVEPAASLLLRLMPGLFVPLCAGVVLVGGDVRRAWPVAVVAVLVSVPAGFLVTARLAPAPPGAPPPAHRSPSPPAPARAPSPPPAEAGDRGEGAGG